MAFTGADTASASWSHYSYHVYLSLRGKDVGKGFGDHLYTGLEQAGFHTFRDDDEIVRREELDIELQKAMQESKLFLIVFSKDYASSTWCLDQLVKIMVLRRSLHCMVVPIFYVDPMLVSDQTDSYAAAFASHEELFKDKADIWRAALREVSDLGGMVLQDGYQAEFVQDTVKMVTKKLNRPVVYTPPLLIGMESRMAEIDLWLQDSSAAQIGVIYGIGGIGKTTIAKEVFNLSLDRFEASCFLPNIRERSRQPGGSVFLQKQLLNTILFDQNVKVNNVAEGSNKIKDAIGCRRVLIVLDDVNHLDQLTTVIASWDWLYEGSRIIITTRHKHLLKNEKICKKFRVEELDEDESLRLFSQHAFRQVQPIDRYLEHSRRAVKNCRGLPLAIQVWGSFLCDIDGIEWSSALDKMEAMLDSKILKILRVSYDSLNDDLDKSLFLHIACFFEGVETDYATTVLDGCELFAKAGIQDLMDRFVVTISEDNRLKMHPLLREMAREIIRQESLEDPGRRSRVWSHDDAISVLRENTGTEAIKGINLDFQGSMTESEQHTCSSASCEKRHIHDDDLVFKSTAKRRVLGLIRGQQVDTGLIASSLPSHDIELETKSFQKMHNLKLLRLNNAKLKGDYKDFPRSLIWLFWHGSSLKYIPPSLCMEKLVVLDMQRSSLKHVWKGTRILPALKILNLSYCHDLVATPDFSGLPCLERLALEGCISLSEIHESIGKVEKLVLLNLKGCIKLRKLPSTVLMLKSLEEIVLSGCLKLDELPQGLDKMVSLKVLHADGIAVKNLTSMSSSRRFTFWDSLFQRKSD
ncbi:Disease resistance protein RUN1 [Linum perenne]